MRTRAIKCIVRLRRLVYSSSIPIAVAASCSSTRGRPRRVAASQAPHSDSGDRCMQTPELEPPVADLAPNSSVLTGYDEQHLVTYLRLLDADAEGADWQEVARIVLHIDPTIQPQRALRAWESH